MVFFCPKGDGPLAPSPVSAPLIEVRAANVSLCPRKPLLKTKNSPDLTQSHHGQPRAPAARRGDCRRRCQCHPARPRLLACVAPVTPPRAVGHDPGTTLGRTNGSRTRRHASRASQYVAQW